MLGATSPPYFRFISSSREYIASMWLYFWNSGSWFCAIKYTYCLPDLNLSIACFSTNFFKYFKIVFLWIFSFSSKVSLVMKRFSIINSNIFFSYSLSISRLSIREVSHNVSSTESNSVELTLWDTLNDSL